jgi:hypothetical protein
MLRNDTRQADFTAIFQPERHLRRQIIIFYGSADTVMSGRICYAGRTISVCTTVKFKGRSASSTPRRPQKFQFLPAGHAKRATRCGNDTATGAAFG